MADRALSQLSQHAQLALTGDDLLYVVDDPLGAPASKKVTLNTARQFIADHVKVLAQDGTGDYTTLASAVAGLSEYDVLFIRNGTYTGGVTISTPNVTIVGESKYNTIIRSPATSTPCFNLTANGITFEDFKIDGLRDGRMGDPDTTKWAGIKLANASYFMARNLWLFEVYGFALSADSASHYGRVLYCTFDDRATNYAEATEGGYAGAIRLSGSDHWTIVGNYLTGESQCVGFWWGARDNLLMYNHIIDNYGYSDAAHTIPRSAFEDYGASTLNLRNQAIGNVIDGTTSHLIECAQGTQGARYRANILRNPCEFRTGLSGVEITSQGTQYTRNISIENNIMLGNNTKGFTVSPGVTRWSANLFKQVTGPNAVLDGVGSYSIIRHNLFWQCMKIAVWLSGNFPMLVDGNMALDSLAGSYGSVYHYGGSAEHVISNNYFDAADVCISMDKGTKEMVFHNTVWGAISAGTYMRVGGNCSLSPDRYETYRLGSYSFMRSNLSTSVSSRNLQLVSGVTYSVVSEFVNNGGIYNNSGNTTNQLDPIHTLTYSRQERPKALGGQTVGTSQVALAHGLAYVPTQVLITMTGDGIIRKSAASDATNIYLTADAAGRTAEIYVR